MDNVPIGTLNMDDGTIDGEPMFEWMENAIKDTQGSSAYSYGRDRPYNGQPHTDFGIRGMTEVSGLTFRDVMDCFVSGLLDCCGEDQPELYEQADKPLFEYLYKVNFEHIDPGAWWQNVACRMEKMMGIYPNVPPLEYKSSDDA
jgi:hypothetical protein